MKRKKKKEKNGGFREVEEEQKADEERKKEKRGRRKVLYSACSKLEALLFSFRRRSNGHHVEVFLGADIVDARVKVLAVLLEHVRAATGHVVLLQDLEKMRGREGARGPVRAAQQRSWHDQEARS
jgi:hypothetical protein